MATYIEIWNLYNDATLRTRTAVACMKAAADVLNEDIGTTGHAARLKWAEAAFANPFQAAQEVMWSVVSNATIAANVYADFGVQIKWAADQSGKTVFFKSVQTCLVDIPGVPAKPKTKTRKAVKAVPATTHAIYNSWDVTDGSGADQVADNTEHNTAPSVTVK